MDKKVGIVVVTYNRLQLLQEEIEALRNQTYNNFQIVVVNNSSTDGTLDWLKSQEDIIIITQDNVGGAGGFYTGMKYVSENNFDFCWVMDDDVVCDPDALLRLVESYKKYPTAGFVCSKVVSVDREPMNVPIIDLRKGHTDYPYWCNESDDMLLRVSKCTFVSVLFPIEIVKEVGLPYKEYFIWGDDWEYTERISSKYISYVCLNSVVVHKRAIQKRITIEEETNQFRLNNYIYLYRNQAYNSVKFNHSSKLNSAYILVRSAVGDLLHGRVKTASIKVKALRLFLCFKPQVHYPKNN